MITVLHGSNRLAIEERLNRLRADIDPTGINTTKIEQVDQNISELALACGSPGFFGTVRLVLAWGLFSERQRARRRKSAPGESASADDRATLLAAVPASTHLVLIEDQLNRTTETSIRRAAPEVQVEKFDVPRGRELALWASERAQRAGTVLPREVATTLLEALFPGTWQTATNRDDVPPDLFRLVTEIEKLAAAAAPEGDITQTLVAELVPEAEGQNLWGLTNAISSGDAAAAIRELERALDGGAAPEALIGQLAAQFEAFAVVSVAPKGMDPATIAAVSGLTEGRVKQTGRSLRNFPPERTRQALNELRTLDLEAKQGQVEVADALVGVVARLATQR